MARFWGKLIKEHRIVKDTVLLWDPIHTTDSFTDLTQTFCDGLDLARPVILSRHLKDMVTFHRTKFRPDDFMDTFPYDAFEIEELVEKKEKERRF